MSAKDGPGKIRDGHSDPRSAKGVERRRELGVQDAIEVKRIADGLLMTLHREPTIADELRAELIGRTACKIRRLAEVRRENLQERQLLESLLRVPFNVTTSVIGPRAPGKAFFVAEKGDDAPADRTAAAGMVEVKHDPS
jgi:hypothetical protein